MPKHEPKTKVIQTNARIIINQEEGSWAVASLVIEFGPNFEQRINLGWVSDRTSQAESYVGIRNLEGLPEPRRCSLHQVLINEAREVINDTEEVPVLTRFERVTREE